MNDGRGRIKADEEARQRYQCVKADVARLLDWLELELERQAGCVAQKGMDAGEAAAELTHARSYLVMALDWLAQRDASDIEKALADSR